MSDRPTDVYGVVYDIMRSFERMACVAQNTAEAEDDIKSSAHWYLIAEIWEEAHMLAAHRLSVYLAEQVQAPSVAKPED